MIDSTKVKLCWRDSVSRQIKEVTIDVEAILRDGRKREPDPKVVRDPTGNEKRDLGNGFTSGAPVEELRFVAPVGVPPPGP